MRAATLSAPDFYMDDFEKAITFGELYKGMKKSARNVRWKDSVAGYEANGLRNTYKLRQSLLHGRYQTDKYQRFQVHEPKTRDIVATRFRDRQFQRALCDNILYPQITRSFVVDNCACQQGKGVQFALDRLTRHLQEYYRQHGPEGWVLSCDVRHYFESTPHEVAMGVLRKQIKDKRAAAYACAIIETFSEDTWRRLFKVKGIDQEPAEKAARAIAVARSERIIAQGEEDPGREMRARIIYQDAIRAIPGLTTQQQRELAAEIASTKVRGIGLGSQASQLVELATLNELDHAIKERARVRHYIRYMDDFLLVHQDKAFLQDCLQVIREKLADMGLALNRKTAIYPIRQGIHFLQWRFILLSSGKVIRRLDSKKLSEERRKLKKLKGLLDAGRISMDDIRHHYQSWRSSKEKGNARGALMRMDAIYKELFQEVPKI